MAVFEQMYLLRRVEPFFVNRLNRIVKTPKVQFLYSGLLSVLVGLNEVSALRDRATFGRALESYVYSELLKQATWAEANYALYMYRDKDQVEVDFVVEDAAGQVVGVEVKAAATVGAGDLTGLKKLARLAGERFIAGIVLYDGGDILPIGERLWAAPLATLWKDGQQ